MSDLSDLAAQCIRCGFCLESCPTFSETGDESLSPRGRIYLAKSAAEGKISWDETKGPLDACLGCRACETACPSGVKYGEILEIARSHQVQTDKNAIKTAFLGAMTSPVMMKAAALAPGGKIPGFLSQAVSGEAPEMEMPRPQPASGWSDIEEAPEVKGEVYLMTGCAMSALFPRVHEATKRLLRWLGYTVRESKGCCGAIHAHSGLLNEADSKAQHLAESMPDDLPIIVNSAGCGSTMKEYGHQIGRGLDQVRANTVDLTEFLLKEGLVDLLQQSPGIERTATYHDACHLAHGQNIRTEPRELLSAIPGLNLKPLNEPDMCCGSAGTYSVLQPKMARRLVERKWRNVEGAEAEILVLGNPGCHSWLAQKSREAGGSISVLHTAEILEASFSGLAGLGL